MKTCDMSSKDHRALCPRTKCSRHPQPSTTSDHTCVYIQRSKHTHAHTHARTSSPSCTCVGTCTSLWFPERLLGSQSPAFPLNAAGPETRRWKPAAQWMTHTTQAYADELWFIKEPRTLRSTVNNQIDLESVEGSKNSTQQDRKNFKGLILCKIPVVF